MTFEGSAAIYSLQEQIVNNNKTIIIAKRLTLA